MLVDNRRRTAVSAVNNEPWLLEVDGRMWRWQEPGCWKRAIGDGVLSFVGLKVQEAVSRWVPPVASETEHGSKTLIWDENPAEGEPSSIVLRDGLIVAARTPHAHTTFRYPSTLRRIAAPAADELCEDTR